MSESTRRLAWGWVRLSKSRSLLVYGLAVGKSRGWVYGRGARRAGQAKVCRQTWITTAFWSQYVEYCPGLHGNVINTYHMQSKLTKKEF